MPWMCHAGVPTWRPRRSTGPMAQVPQGVENKRRGRRTNPRSVTWDVHLTAQGAGWAFWGVVTPFCWKPRRIRGSWVHTFVDSSQSYIGSGALGAHGAPCKACRSKQWQAALKRRAAQSGPFCRASILQWTTCGSMWRRWDSSKQYAQTRTREC